MDPLLKLAVDIAGSEKVRALKKDLDDQRQAVLTLNAALAAGQINQQQYAAAMAVTGTAAKNLTTQLQRTAPAFALTGQGMMQLAYIADDVRYGFSAIVNNLPGLVQGLGLGAGVAGAAGIAGVAFSILITHWGEMTSLLQSAWTGKPVSELEALRKAAEETAEAFDKLTQAKTKAESAKAAATKDAIAEGPVGNVFGQLVGKIMGDKTILPDQPGLAGSPMNFGQGKGRSAAEVREGMAKEMAKRIMTGGAKPGAETEMLASITSAIENKATQKRYERSHPTAIMEAAQDEQNRADQKAYMQKQLTAELSQQEQNQADQKRYMQKQYDRDNSPLSQQNPEAWQQMMNDRQARHNVEQSDNAQQKQNQADQRQYMARQADAQRTKVQQLADQMMQSPLGAAGMMAAGGLRPSTIARQLRGTGENAALAGQVKVQMDQDALAERQQMMREHGWTEQRARQEQLLANVMRNDPDFGRKRESSMTGVGELWAKLQTGALGPDKLLTAAQEHNRLLRLLLAKQNGLP
jgi:hypothetical protein